MIRCQNVEVPFIRIHNGEEYVDFEWKATVSPNNLREHEKVIAIVRTPIIDSNNVGMEELHGDFLTIFKNLVRDEDGNIVFFDPKEKLGRWRGLVLALEDSDIKQGRNNRNFWYGAVE